MSAQADQVIECDQPWGWAHIPHPHPGVYEIHLLPVCDVGAHAFDLECRCCPVVDVDNDGFIVHFAYDGREAYEDGARKRH